MPKDNTVLLAWNRGLVSELALARKDIKRLGLSAVTYTNWMPRLLGSMMLRPGLIYTGTSHSNAAARHIPFKFSVTDTAIIEVTNLLVRVKVSETAIARSSVTTTIANTTFDTNLTNWTDADEGSAASAWVTGGFMGLTGASGSYAIRTQNITSSNYSTEHALRVVVERGPVTLRVGSSAGGDEYINETKLGTGTHSLAFTPTGTMYIQLKNDESWQALVSECSIESSGVMTITAPWAAADLDLIRYDQSGDIVYVSCEGYQQYRIERRATRSWSVVKHEPTDGPFRTINITKNTLTASALSGSITLTASKPLFRSGHVGCLFRQLSTGQTVTASLSAENTFTDAIKITGTGARRRVHVVVTGTWVATIRAQRRYTENGTWEDVPAQAFSLVATSSGSNNWDGSETANFDKWVTDFNDNETVYYRVGIKTGGYTSGTAVIELSSPFGGIQGIARITAITSSTVASAVVLKSFGSTAASENWWEGEWSTQRGYPGAVALSQGRLWWAGNDRIWASVSDSYDSHDDNAEGDSAPISQAIGSGPVDSILWLLNLQRLLIGGGGDEFVAQSSALDEPMTPSNFNIKPGSGQGSDPVDGVKIGLDGVFVQRGGAKLMELAYEPKYGQYAASDLCTMVPDIGKPGIIRIAVQRQPDTRIHCVRSDGTVAVCLLDRTENLICWVEVETDGDVEDAFVLPGTSGDGEDKVYYHVNRTINGSTVRYLERWALEADCIGGSVSKCVDSAYIYSGASTATITGLDHLEGETVQAWGGGKDLGEYTVASGSITLSEAVTGAAIGLAYTAQWQSAKLGQALCSKGKITHLGVVLKDTHYQGLKYGRNFTDMDELPLISEGALSASDTVHSDLEEAPFEFPGEWSTDSRLCLQATAPRPCTILAAVVLGEGNLLT
jgi:hypothetical protein